MSRASGERVEFSVNIQCADCGEELKVEQDIDFSGQTSLSVKPCEKCLEERESDTREELEDELEDLRDKLEEARKL